MSDEVLNCSVLVLNKSYMPLRIVSAKRALVLLYNEIAEAVTIEDGTYCTYNFGSWAEASEYKKLYEDSPDHDWVFTPSMVIDVPRVIRLLTYSKMHRYELKLTRRNIYARDSSTCQYCGKKFEKKDLNIDHVIPRSKGGLNTWTNLVCACLRCNVKKSNKTLVESGMKLVRKPEKPEYSPYIKLHIKSKKYESWKQFISESYWTVELEDDENSYHR